MKKLLMFVGSISPPMFLTASFVLAGLSLLSYSFWPASYYCLVSAVAVAYIRSVTKE